MDELWRWIAGIGIPIVSGVGWFVIHAHRRQVERLDELNKSNSDAHMDIHTKIDAMDRKSEERHHVVRDKIEKVWQHLVNK